MNIEELIDKYPLQKGYNNPILKNKSEKISSFNKETKDFGKALQELMFEYDGAGLAAPQIGKNIRMIAVTKWKKVGRKLKMVDSEIMINPEILSHSKDTDFEEEGCLSFPGVYGDVERYKSIKVRYQDINGNQKIITENNFNARIIQHEIDHLDGITLPDRIEKIDMDFSKFVKLS